MVRATVRAFWEKHSDAEPSLKIWLRTVKNSLWTSPADIKAVFGSASFVGADRVVFNIAGNKYRLIVKVEYERKTVLVRFIGTHAEYDSVNAAEV